jgi:hypothetical protein
MQLNVVSRARLNPENKRLWVPLITLMVAALACHLPESSKTETPQEQTGLEAAQAIYDEAGISFEEALAVPSEDQRPGILNQLGPPDAFKLEWQELEGELIRWEEWSYFDFESRFDFVDGELLWTLDLDPAPDGSFYAHAFDPLAFSFGMSMTEIEVMLPDVELTELPLEEADIPGGLLLAGDQILLGFDQDQLVFVQTFILEPEEPLAFPEELEPTSTPSVVAEPTISSESNLLLLDRFEDPSNTATPLFSSQYMDFELDNAIGTLTAYDPGILVATYPSPQVADFAATLILWAPDPQPGAGYGMVFRSDDAADGLAHYYLLQAQPADGLLRLRRYSGGQMTDLYEGPLPDTGDMPFVLYVRVEASEIHVDVNGEHAFLLEDSALPEPGIFGLAMVSPTSGDRVLFDELRVEKLDE